MSDHVWSSIIATVMSCICTVIKLMYKKAVQESLGLALLLKLFGCTLQVYSNYSVPYKCMYVCIHITATYKPYISVYVRTLFFTLLFAPLLIKNSITVAFPKAEAQ